MNNKEKILVISDLHLEKKKDVYANFILEGINNSVYKEKELGNNPIVVCAGDLHNGAKGLPFLEKIDAPVIYICGNHEFWDNSYLQVKEDIKNNLPKNVTFLDNDIKVIGDFLFVGATLWSDLGQQLNPDLFEMTANVMNDNRFIAYPEWYQNKDNVAKLETLNKQIDSEIFIENKYWNVIAEREENEKTLMFYHELMYVINILEKFYDKNYNSVIAPEITMEKWLEDKKKDLLPYVFRKKDVVITQNMENVFQKLKNYKNIAELKLILVTHHSPLLEEREIGTLTWNDDISPGNYCNTLLDSIYQVRSGLDYGLYNYFYRISKGEFDKDKAITQVVHYSNDGSNNFPESLLDRVYAYVHGHEHNYNYEDTIKCAKIVTNPICTKMGFFVYENGKVSINDMYKKYHNIIDDDPLVEKEKSNLVRVPNFSLSKENLKEATMLWALKMFDWEDYGKKLEYAEYLNKKIFLNVIKNPQWQFQMDDKSVLNIKILADAADVALKNIIEMEEALSHAIAIRNSVSYSFNKKYANIIENDNFISNYIRSSKIEKLGSFMSMSLDFSQGLLLQTSFFNKEGIIETKKQMNKIISITDKFKEKKIYEFTIEEVDAFINELDKIRFKYDFHKNGLREKLHKQMIKYQYNEHKAQYNKGNEYDF